MLNESTKDKNKLSQNEVDNYLKLKFKEFDEYWRTGGKNGAGYPLPSLSPITLANFDLRGLEFSKKNLNSIFWYPMLMQTNSN